MKCTRVYLTQRRRVCRLTGCRLSARSITADLIQTSVIHIESYLHNVSAALCETPFVLPSIFSCSPLVGHYLTRFYYPTTDYRLPILETSTTSPRAFAFAFAIPREKKESSDESVANALKKKEYKRQGDAGPRAGPIFLSRSPSLSTREASIEERKTWVAALHLSRNVDRSSLNRRSDGGT